MGIWMLKILFLAIVIYVFYTFMVITFYAVNKTLEKKHDGK